MAIRRNGFSRTIPERWIYICNDWQIQPLARDRILQETTNSNNHHQRDANNFANKGIPAVCQSDNGQPFQSADIKTFASKQGFMLKHITPEWPRANGTVERFNRCMKEAIQAGHVEGKPMRDSAMTFLQSYRASPHTTKKKSPFAAMHGGREMRTKLPTGMYCDDVIDWEQVERTKAKMISKDINAKEHRLQVGDRVVVMQKKKNKLTTAFDPTPLTITSIKGSMITASKQGWTITRCFKILQVIWDFTYAKY